MKRVRASAAVSRRRRAIVTYTFHGGRFGFITSDRERDAYFRDLSATFFDIRLNRFLPETLDLDAASILGETSSAALM
jgi:hypothetical protein